MLVTNFNLKFALYKIICAFYQAADVGRIHPVRERSLRALQRTVDYIEREMPDSLGFDSPRELLEFSLRAVAVEGHYLEFGVFTGGTIRFIARRLPGRAIHGFDSFEGLPEAWSGFNLERKAFNRGGRMPRAPQNVHLHRGWFEQSIPVWMETNPGAVAFMHIDCDIYSSAATIFRLLADRVATGTIIVFDEYFNYPNWEQHEYKAFQEFVLIRNVTYRYLAFARQQVVIRIESMADSRC